MGPERERSDLQRAVANHWANKYNSKPTPERLESPPVTEIKDEPEVVELGETTTEGSEEEELEVIEEREFKRRKQTNEVLLTPLFSSSKLQIPSPVHVFDTPVLRPPDSESILSFWHSKLLRETYVFSFELDVEFITSEMYDLGKTQVNIIAQNLYNVKKRNNISYVGVQDVITSWSCHHSKLVINFYRDDTMQVFVSTSNFTPDEYGVLGGVFWKSELLLADANSSGKQDFKIDLCNYLAEYKKPQIDQLIEKIKVFDFSSVKASFVGSTPGQSSGKFGYLRLHQHLKSRNLFPDTEVHKNFKFLAQTSTIAGPFKYADDKASNILTHLLLPLIMNKPFPLDSGEESLQAFMRNKEFGIDPIIVFPTIHEIFQSKGGIRGAGCMIYNNLTKNGILQDKIISKFFHKRNVAEQSSFVNNHSKIYLFTEDDFQTLNWCFIGSMNLSKAAWGAPGKNNSLRGCNWECGVLLDPKDFETGDKFVPVFNTNKLGTGSGKLGGIPIRLPFKLPVQKYDLNDKVWCRFDPLLQG